MYLLHCLVWFQGNVRYSGVKHEREQVKEEVGRAVMRREEKPEEEEEKRDEEGRGRKRSLNGRVT